ncbi:glycosyltransferase [Pseudochrobactrum sp. Wa41.01b-1]|nr:glycosyltransferase [Pseudochrobactrum sp. Wa41.01b-1]QYM73336.1 glycosyltransferase [Pseudochrobactrum sp. Wa41.01b-1]
MANILVVSDYFNGGGLETQICGQVLSLAEYNDTFYLATSSASTPLATHTFKECIFDLHMMRATSGQLLETINKITMFVKKNDIDVIHAHPFTSLIIGMAVAHINAIRFIGTLHGPASLFSAAETTTGLLLNKGFLPQDNTVITVSPETMLLTKATAACNPIILPNSVSIPHPIPAITNTTKPWAWYGRIDGEKLVGLINLITFITTTKTSILHIYGDGPEKDTLLDKINELDAESNLIAYKGWVDNSSNTFSNYSVIAGMGRVILEAASYNKICLLVGYDGVKTFMTPALAEKASFWNFSGRGMKNIPLGSFISQWHEALNTPTNFSLLKWTQENHDEKRVWNKYKAILDKKNSFKSNIIDDFLNVLHYLGDSEVSFWEDSESFLLLKKILQHQS